MLYRLDRVHRHRQQVFLPLLQVCLLLLLLSPRLQAVVSKMLVPLHKFHHQNLSPPPRSLVLIRSFPTTLPPFSLVLRKPSALAPVVPQSQQNWSPKSFPNQYFELSELLPESLDEPISDTTSFAIEGSTIVPVSKSARPNPICAYMALILRTAKRFVARPKLTIYKIGASCVQICTIFTRLY